MIEARKKEIMDKEHDLKMKEEQLNMEGFKKAILKLAEVKLEHK